MVVDVIGFISLTMLVPPGNTTVNKQTNDSNCDIDEIVDKTTAGGGSCKAPPSKREKNHCYSKTGIIL